MPKDILQMLLNDELALEFDREVELPDYQQSYLTEMDLWMDIGIQVGEDTIKSPGMLERSQHVTHTMVDALIKDNTDDANAMCAYLATRIPDLAQVNCKTSKTDKGISIKLIYKQDLT